MIRPALFRWSFASSACHLGAFVVVVTLAATPALADRYWDVKAEAADGIARRVTGKVVVERCGGCDGQIFVASQIIGARTAKGDYSDGKQVKITRGAALIGSLSDTGALTATKCFPSGGDSQDTAVKAHGFTPNALDIPYASVLEDRGLVWVGDGLIKDSGANSAALLDATAKAAVTKCIAAVFPAPPAPKSADAFLFSTEGPFKPQTHKIDVDGDGKSEAVTWALVKGTLVRDVLPPRKKKVTVRYAELRLKKSRELLFRQAVPADVEAEGPTGDISAMRAGVVLTHRGSAKSPAGFGVVLSTNRVDDFSFVEVNFGDKKTRKLKPRARLHWLGRLPRTWDAAFAVDGGSLAVVGKNSGANVRVVFDPKLDRFTAEKMRWAAGDELNARARAQSKAKKIGYLDLGDVSVFDENKMGDSRWTPVTLLEGPSGYVFSKYMDAAAPFFDVSAGANDGRGVRRRATLLEALALDFTRADLVAMRKFGDRVRRATKVSNVCKLLVDGEALEGQLVMHFFNDKFESSGGDEWNRAFTIIPRVEAEAQAFSFIIFSEGSIVNLERRRLSSRLPRRAPERYVLQATDALSAGLDPIWIDRRHDFGGCAMPRRALPSFKILKKQFPKAKTCLQTAVRPALTKALERFSNEKCFCNKKSKALKSVDVAAKALSDVSAFDGAKLVEHWRKEVDSKDAEFNSSCTP